MVNQTTCACKMIEISGKLVVFHDLSVPSAWPKIQKHKAISFSCAVAVPVVLEKQSSTNVEGFGEEKMQLRSCFLFN